MMNKIYIIGPVGSGKTTLANVISKKLNIKKYELDNIQWDDSHGCHRPLEERIKMFDEILNKKSFIIEDVGRDIFREGRKQADIVYYIKLSKVRTYFRVIKRWVKQKVGLEKYNYRPTIKGLFDMFGWAYGDLKNRDAKILEIKTDSKNFVILSYHDVKKLMGGKNNAQDEIR